MKSLVRTIVWGAFGILVLVMLAKIAPGLVFGLLSVVALMIGWSTPVVFTALFIQSWRLSKKIGMRGFKLRAKFMLLRAFQDVFRSSYNDMVRGDADTKPDLNKAQRLRLLHHDNGLTAQQLNEGLAALRATGRRNNDKKRPEARTAPSQEAQAVQETPVVDKTAPKANSLAQQARTSRPTTPVEEQRHEVPIEDTRGDETVELDEVEFTEPAPAPRLPRPAPQPRRTPRPNSTGVNHSSGFGGSIRITGDWGQPKH